MVPLLVASLIADAASFAAAVTVGAERGEPQPGRAVAAPLLLCVIPLGKLPNL